MAKYTHGVRHRWSNCLCMLYLCLTRTDALRHLRSSLTSSFFRIHFCPTIFYRARRWWETRSWGQWLEGKCIVFWPWAPSALRDLQDRSFCWHFIVFVPPMAVRTPYHAKPCRTSGGASHLRVVSHRGCYRKWWPLHLGTSRRTIGSEVIACPFEYGGVNFELFILFVAYGFHSFSIWTMKQSTGRWHVWYVTE